MTRSMTGYGKAETELNNAKLSIEIKSLNSKQIDLNVRLPHAYNSKEVEIRSVVSKFLERGKISVFINKESLGEDSKHEINTQLATNYYNQVKQIADNVGSESTDILSVVMRMPDIVKQSNAEVDKQELKQLMTLLNQTLANIDEFRIEEAKAMEKDFRLRVANILELLLQVEPLETVRIERVKERLEQALLINIDETKVDKNRFEQEVIFYLEKFDITEEKVRLKKHCDYFIETLDNDNKSKGKKLGFISQEIGREINTLGSKSNDSEMQKIVVNMKDELEKIKEQALNVL